MRMKKRQASEDKAWQIVDASSYGILSMIGLDGNPYAVALNLCREGKTLYFHSAMEGKKIDCLRRHAQVSVCFVSYTEEAPQALTMHYSSAILSGTAEEVTVPEEKLKALQILCRKHGVSEEHPAMKKNFSSCMPETAVWCIRVQTITGKEYR